MDEKIRKSPQNPKPYVERAELLFSIDKENLYLAVRDYMYAIFLDPGLSEAYYDLIQRLTMGGDISRASRFAEEACRLFSQEGNAYGWRAYVKYAKNLYHESIEDCNKAIDRQANRWFYNTRGRCYMGLNQLNAALEDFAMAYSIDCRYSDAINNIKLTVEKIGISNVLQFALDKKKTAFDKWMDEDFEKAIMYFECVLLTNPDSVEGLQEYGGLYYDFRKYLEALSLWK